MRAFLYFTFVLLISCNSYKKEVVKEEVVIDSALVIQEPESLELETIGNSKVEKPHVEDWSCDDQYQSSDRLLNQLKSYGFPIKMDTLGGKSIDVFLDDERLNADDRKFYNGEFGLMDDCHTFGIIDRAKVSPKDLAPFYVYLFTQILLCSDASVTTYLQGIAWVLMEKYPDEVFELISRLQTGVQKEVLESYAWNVDADLAYMLEEQPNELKAQLFNHIEKIKREMSSERVEEVDLALRYFEMVEDLNKN